MIEIKSLKELRHNDNGRFGNKAVRLGELIGQGVNVPKGFCISIDLHEYVERNGSDSIPEPTLKELEDIYLSFGGKAVAVRSSSIVEDLAQSSFAGLYDSFLNIASFDSMVQKIIQCIKSAGQEHVNEYSKNFDIDRRRIKMAVIIQEMVAAEYSGVLFTANPINNRYDQYVINGAEGLGEKVVDGSVIPEQWVISKETETVINVTDKMESGVLMESGILDEAMLKSFIQNAKEIEEHFNYPQDIEWSMIEGQVYILQSRDITTLYPVDSDVRNLEKQHLYLCYNTIIQGMNEPFTPLGAEFWRLTFAGYTSIYFNGKKKILYPNWIKNINGRIHYDVTEVVGKKSYIKKLPGSLNAKDPSGGKLMGEILEQHRSTFLNQGGKFKLSFGIVKWGLSLLKYGKLGKTNPEKAVEEVKQMGDEYIERLKLRVKNADTLRKKLKLIEEVTEEYLTLAFQQVMYCSYGLKSAEKHDKWIEKQYGQKFDLDIIKKALPNNPTTEMGLAMSRIAVELNEKQQELTVEHPLIQEFIDRKSVV